MLVSAGVKVMAVAQTMKHAGSGARPTLLGPASRQSPQTSVALEYYQNSEPQSV